MNSFNGAAASLGARGPRDNPAEPLAGTTGRATANTCGVCRIHQGH